MSIDNGRTPDALKRLGKKEGPGITPREELLNEFARKADISLDEAKLIMTGNTDGLNQGKVVAFTEAAGNAYGGFDNFEIIYENTPETI